jgi:hypothetical protein
LRTFSAGRGAGAVPVSFAIDPGAQPRAASAGRTLAVPAG